MEPECSLPKSQVPITCPYPEPVRSSPHPHISLPEDRTKPHVSFSLLMLYQNISPGPWLTLWLFRNMMRFYSEELLAPRPTPKLEDHLLSAVRNCLFHIFAATLHIGGRSSIHNLRTRHAVVTGTHLSWRSVYTETHTATDRTSFQILQITSFWVLTIGADVGWYCLFGGICCLHLQGPSVFWIDSEDSSLSSVCRNVIGQVFPDVSKGRIAFIFKVRQSTFFFDRLTLMMKEIRSFQMSRTAFCNNTE